MVTLGVDYHTAYNMIILLSTSQLTALAFYCLGHRRKHAIMLLAASQSMEMVMFRAPPVWRMLAIFQIALSRSEAIKASLGCHVGMNLLSSLGAADKLNELLCNLVSMYSLGMPLAAAGCYGFARNAFAPLMFHGYEAQLGRERFAKALGWAAFCFSFASYDKHAPLMRFSLFKFIARALSSATQRAKRTGIDDKSKRI